MIGLLAE